MADDLEPFIGIYDYDEANCQNPDEPWYEASLAERIRVHGSETAEDAQARAVAIEAEEWAAVAYLDTGGE